jgi:hypothetical protein
MRISIPYELMKIYRDQGIDLTGLTPMYHFGESFYCYEDRFINNAF